MQSQLLSINGKGVVSGDETEKKRKGSPCLSNLELGIGSSGGLSCLIKQEKDEFVFTAAQFQELQLQVVIFKYIVCGLPVPIHLVPPVWKSFAAALSSAESGFYQKFPSFLGFDHRITMDPEPGRCRRTDGKKWRCYRNVVPHQKYCERHMHRGCPRLRKHVETSEDISKSNASKSVPGTFNGGSVSYNGNGNRESRVNNGTPTSSLIRVLADKNNTKYQSNYNDGRCLNVNRINTNKIEWSNLENKNYSDASVAPRFGLSPKSVLQGGTVLGFDYRITMDPEPGRCRRTDGKKWRCYRNVVPHQKYCERHMHRGRPRSRKHVETSEDISKSNASKSVPGTFNGGSVSYTGNGNRESRVNNGTPTSSLIRVLADKNNTKYQSNYNDGRCLNVNRINTNKIEWSNLENKNYSDASVAPRFGLSPQSVLQGGTAAGCSRLNFDSKTLAETEPLRCRRTDGKRWRCSRDVVPEKKYCETHLHRGAKKAEVDSKLIIGASAAPPSCRIETCGTATKVEKIVNLNTDLSISIAATPQKTSDADSSSFGNSDATTVTDEYATSSHNLSP